MSLNEECAHRVVEVVPLAMREIRHELRRYGGRSMSVPQFRTVLFLERRRGASLSEVARHIGLTLTSTSTMVDVLVKRGLVKRESHSDDRRRVTLTLTDRGTKRLESAREATVARLANLLKDLSMDDRKMISGAMETLKKALGGDGK